MAAEPGRKILVADDSAMVVALLSRLLGGAGYTTVSASNGIEAVQAAYREFPDLILLDIFMPRMNGYQACRLLKDDPAVSHIPILILSASESRDDAFWSLQTGADRFMNKAFQPAELLAAVQQLLPPAPAPAPEPPLLIPGPEDILSRVSALIDRELYATSVQRIELQTVLQSLSDGIVVLDAGGTVKSSNTAAREMIGVAESELTGIDCRQVFGMPAGPVIDRLARATIAGEGVGSEQETEIVSRQGMRLPIAVTASSITDYLGKTVGCVCVLHDITRRKEIEALGRLKDDLTKMIVHDLRTPLTALIGGLDTIEMLGDINDDQRQFLQMSIRGGDTLLRMINDLLDISKMEDGSMRLDCSDLGAEALIAEACGQLASLATEKGLLVEVAVAGDTPVLYVDEDKIVRTLVNLLGNAIKFTPVSGRITIATRRLPDDGATEFSVQDTGEGIPPESFTRIFEKFGQVDGRKSGRKHSTGLGLTFCKMVAEAHGGRIWVESELGVGSTFRFTIPPRIPQVLGNG